MEPKITIDWNTGPMTITVVWPTPISRILVPIEFTPDESINPRKADDPV
jgi:hypothetical protein